MRFGVADLVRVRKRDDGARIAARGNRVRASGRGVRSESRRVSRARALRHIGANLIPR